MAQSCRLFKPRTLASQAKAATRLSGASAAMFTVVKYHFGMKRYQCLQSMVESVVVSRRPFKAICHV